MCRFSCCKERKEICQIKTVVKVEDRVKLKDAENCINM